MRRYAGSPSQADLERMFFLDDEDMALINQHRGEHMRAGFALQLVTVRWLGTFLDDPLDVPPVLEFVAGQLGVTDPLVVNKYGERAKTLSDHQIEIRRAEGLRDFTEAQEELTGWVGAARSWTSGDGPKAIFLDALAWMHGRKILLPGVSRLARLGARVRDDTTHRLWAELERLLRPG